MKGRVVLAHCWQGSPAAGWYPDLAARLAPHGIEATVPALPDPMTPSPEPWRRAIADALGAPDARTVLVGHSLGTAAVLRALEALADDATPLAGVLLVAGFAEDPGIDELRPFYERPFDLARIRRRAARFAALHSDDDPYARPEPLHHARRFARELGAALTILPGRRHFAPTYTAALPEAAWRIRELLDPDGHDPRRPDARSDR